MYTYIYIILHLYLYLYLYIYNMYVYIYICITCIFCVPIRFGAQWKIASENLSPGLSECLSLPRCMVRTTRTRRQGAVVLAQEVYDIGGCFHPNLSYLVYIYILYVFMADFPYPFVCLLVGISRMIGWSSNLSVCRLHAVGTGHHDLSRPLCKDREVQPARLRCESTWGKKG